MRAFGLTYTSRMANYFRLHIQWWCYNICTLESNKWVVSTECICGPLSETRVIVLHFLGDSVRLIILLCECSYFQWTSKLSAVYWLKVSIIPLKLSSTPCILWVLIILLYMYYSLQLIWWDFLPRKCPFQWKFFDIKIVYLRMCYLCYGVHVMDNRLLFGCGDNLWGTLCHWIIGCDCEWTTISSLLSQKTGNGLLQRQIYKFQQDFVSLTTS